jgi:subtilisin family serine protease
LVLSIAAGILLAQQADRAVTPNDPYFKYQVTFQNPGGPLKIPEASNRTRQVQYAANAGLDLDITRAWSIATGSKDVVVALLDDGFLYQHEDVKENIWNNPGETGIDANGLRKETNGIDDDHNGYVDDVMGWDFAFNDPDPDAYAFDGMDKTRIQPFWHSISAMGIIGAKGNNGIGVAGINWNVSMMLLRIGAQRIHIRYAPRADRPSESGFRIRFPTGGAHGDCRRKPDEGPGRSEEPRVSALFRDRQQPGGGRAGP